MNQEKIGSFIANLRKMKKLTQEELAEKIGVSSKTVSRWETGKNLPDYSILPVLSKIFEVTINDLLSGEIVKNEEYSNKLEENIVTNLSIISKKQKIYQRIFWAILVIPIIFILILVFINCVQFRIDFDKKTMYVDKTFAYNNLRMTYENNCVNYMGGYNHKITTLQEYGKTTSIIFVSATCTIKGMMKKEIGTYYSFDNIISKDLINVNSYKVYYYNGNLNDIVNQNNIIKKYIQKSKLVYES